MGISENGFTTDELAYHWIHHFDQFTSKRQTGAYRLLLMDNHGSHLTLQFLTYCWDNKIIPFTFPPHLTHRLQPLDLIPFQQYKLNHGREVNRAARMTLETFDKIDFLAAIEHIRRETFQTHIIKAGWRDAGIRPFRSTEKLAEIRGRSSSPILEISDGDEPNSNPPNPPNPLEAAYIEYITPVEVPKTPTTIRGLRRQIDYSIKSHPDLSPSIQRVFRGAIIAGEMSGQFRDELKEYQEYHLKRSENRSHSQSYLKTRGVTYVRDAIREVDEKKAVEVEKERKRMKKRGKKIIREALLREDFSSESELDLPEVPRTLFQRINTIWRND